MKKWLLALLSVLLLCLVVSGAMAEEQHEMTYYPETGSCTEAGYCEYKVCSYCGMAHVNSNTEIYDIEAQKAEGGAGYLASLGHDWDEVITYTWDGDQCTAQHVCKRDASHVEDIETVTAAFVVDTEATCENAHQTGR